MQEIKWTCIQAKILSRKILQMAVADAMVEASQVNSFLRYSTTSLDVLYIIRGY